MMRPSGRKLDELRNVVIEINPMRHAEGSCRVWDVAQGDKLSDKA